MNEKLPRKAESESNCQDFPTVILRRYAAFEVEGK
jgi:hypothetical protein